MRWAAEGWRDPPLVAHRQEGFKCGPVLGPKPELFRFIGLWQFEAEERCICLGFAAIWAGEASTSPDLARLGQFPRFAPIIAAL